MELLRRLLKDEPLVSRDDAFDIARSLPHGHVDAVLGTLKRLGLERIIDPRPSPERDRIVALIVARVLDPGSGLSTARGLSAAPARASRPARAKAASKRNAEGDPAHSFRALLDDLATLSLNTVQPRLPGAAPSQPTTHPTALQSKAFELLGARP